MKKYLNNNFVDLSIHGNAHIIDVFSAASGKKKIIVGDNAYLVYLVVAKSSSLDLQIDVQGQNSVCQIFAIFVSDKEPVDASIITHIAGSSAKVEKHIISLLGETGKISVDANIDILPGVKNIVAHLLEENIIFGQNISVKSLPALSVASHDVKASHGAKIEKINQDKLFYMQSKGLSQNDSQKLVVDGYVNSILSHFATFSEEELSSVKNLVQL